MKVQVSPEIYDAVNSLDIKDQESFKILEEYILQYGLENIATDTSDIHSEHLQILKDRLHYDERNLSLYFSSLDTIYQLRKQFSDHMHNQNVIQVCLKDNAEKEIEINRLKLLMKGLSDGNS